MNVVIPERECDGYLGEKLVAELSGILNWALAGAARLHARGRYELPTCLQRELDELAEDNNPISTWTDQALEADDECEVSSRNLVYSHLGFLFENYGRKAVDRAPAHQTITKAIRAKFPKCERRQSNGQSFYHGIRVTEVGLDQRRTYMRAQQMEFDPEEKVNRPVSLF
jgi:phage/plasmid-associated DNA primase